VRWLRPQRPWHVQRRRVRPRDLGPNATAKIEWKVKAGKGGVKATVSASSSSGCESTPNDNTVKVAATVVSISDAGSTDAGVREALIDDASVEGGACSCGAVGESQPVGRGDCAVAPDLVGTATAEALRTSCGAGSAAVDRLEVRDPDQERGEAIDSRRQRHSSFWP